MSRLLRAALALALSILFPLVAAPAHASTGKCTAATGVTVVVDFGNFGGGVVVRCAENASGSGLSALHAAGFSTQGTIKDGPGFVCRINNLPSPAKEACQFTPKSGDNWSYWHAANGGSWSYSQAGAANRQVISGGFEGWTFGGAPPAVTPTRPAATNSESRGGDGSSDESDVAKSGEPSSKGGAALPKPKPREVKPSPLPTGVADLSRQSATAETADAASSADADGSATAWIAGGILVTIALAIAVAHRRRA